MNDYIDAAYRQYIETLLWSDTWCDCTDDSVTIPLDDLYDYSDIPNDRHDKVRSDLADFVVSNWDDLADMDPEQTGHDFALTRNGHGAGFWDRGLGAKGDRLTEACRPYGEFHLSEVLPEPDPRILADILKDY